MKRVKELAFSEYGRVISRHQTIDADHRRISNGAYNAVKSLSQGHVQNSLVWKEG